MSKKPLVLLIDTREKGTLHKKLAELFPHEYLALGAGDYWIPKKEGFIVIERSTYQDFIGKIMSGRLWEQMKKCTEKSDDVYFLLENPYGQKFTKFSYKATIGAKTSLSRHVKIFETRNVTESFLFIKYLYEKYNMDRKFDFKETRYKPKGMTDKENARYCLMGIQGIGQQTADKLLENLTLAELTLFEREQLEKLIGDRLAKKIYQTFNAK